MLYVIEKMRYLRCIICAITSGFCQCLAYTVRLFWVVGVQYHYVWCVFICLVCVCMLWFELVYGWICVYTLWIVCVCTMVRI